MQLAVHGDFTVVNVNTTMGRGHDSEL